MIYYMSLIYDHLSSYINEPHLAIEYIADVVKKNYRVIFIGPRRE